MSAAPERIELPKPTLPAAADSLGPDDFFYDGHRYYGPGINGEVVPLTLGDVRRMLALAGIANTKNDPAGDEAVVSIQRSRYALRVGPIAGFRKGWHDVPDGRVYVTSEVNPVTPADTGCQRVLRLLDESLGETQAGWLLRWLAVAYRSLSSGIYRPGQVVALVGPRNAGKSLFADLIGEVLGGRVAHPYKQWSGSSQFNGHCVAAELLVIDDEFPSREVGARRAFASGIKSHLFSASVGIEIKHCTPFTCRPWWRCVVTCNDSPEEVVVLPPLDPGFEDKLALLYVQPPSFPERMECDKVRAAFRQELSRELPGLVHHALGLPMDSYGTDGRTGIATYHDQRVVELLRELTVAAMLEDLLERAAGAGVLPVPWTGTAGELEQLLKDSAEYRDEAKRLFDRPTRASYMLRTLAKDRPGMVARDSQAHGGKARFRITIGGRR